MQISLSSGNYDIDASGQAFLYSKDNDFRIDIQADNGFAFSLILNFIADESGKSDIQMSINDNIITLNCINFENTGRGAKEPVKVATIDGRDLNFTFRAYLEGIASRYVSYTLFYER